MNRLIVAALVNRHRLFFLWYLQCDLWLKLAFFCIFVCNLLFLWHSSLILPKHGWKFWNGTVDSYCEQTARCIRIVRCAPHTGSSSDRSCWQPERWKEQRTRKFCWTVRSVVSLRSVNCVYVLKPMHVPQVVTWTETCYFWVVAVLSGAVSEPVRAFSCFAV